MLKKLLRYYRTIKHLKWIQIYYRLWYILRGKFRKFTGHSYPKFIPTKASPLRMKDYVPKCNSLRDDNTFTFLNKTHTFGKEIDWNYTECGKLWAYNLNYFDFLLQEQISKEQGLHLIYDFIRQMDNNREGLEAYPTSLRIINWVKFIVKNNIADPKIDACLYAQLQILRDNLEYHILGNHLLENGCALLFGGYYFNDQKIVKEAKKILLAQLNEQIMADGGHFERSTMYHLIILDRLLDCYNLLTTNTLTVSVERLTRELRKKNCLMIGWIEKIVLEDDTIPLLNDAARNVAPNYKDILAYAIRLNLESKKRPLKESGYRHYKDGFFDLLCDVGDIGPEYLPAHAHSDTLSFVLGINKIPFIIDPGISTYEKNEIRKQERSTTYHNTVAVAGKEQTDCWGTFRVGERAKITHLSEAVKRPFSIDLTASHNGYKKIGVTHTRTWKKKSNTSSLTIIDTLKGGEQIAQAFFHISPFWHKKVCVQGCKVLTEYITMTFKNSRNVRIEKYACPDGYNQFRLSKKIIVTFRRKLCTTIQYKSQ